MKRDAFPQDHEVLCDAFAEHLTALQQALERADLSKTTPSRQRRPIALARRIAEALDRLAEKLRIT